MRAVAFLYIIFFSISATAQIGDHKDGVLSEYKKCSTCRNEKWGISNSGVPFYTYMKGDSALTIYKTYYFSANNIVFRYIELWPMAELGNVTTVLDAHYVKKGLLEWHQLIYKTPTELDTAYILWKIEKTTDKRFAVVSEYIEPK